MSILKSLFQIKWTSLTPEVQIQDPHEDSKKRTRIGQYIISAKAIYRPDGTYLPLECIQSISQDTGSVHVTGCCAGAVPVDRLVIRTNDDTAHVFIFDSAKQAQKACDLLNK